jgi:hypothetical protein
MSAVSVLLIGASGAFGQPLLHELIRQKSAFKRIAILAANEEKARTFVNARKDGIEVTVASFLETSSYAGITKSQRPCCPELTTHDKQASPMSSQQWAMRS